MKVLITGASSGIGERLAYELDSRGYDLILVAKDQKNLSRVAVKCKHAITIKCDLRNEQEVYKLFEETKNLGVDFLINNAGFGLFGEFTKTDLTRELEMIDVNVKAMHILTKLYLEKFVKEDKGRILIVASSAGFMAGPRLSTYYATKNYILKLTLAIYEELRRTKSNVHISALCPGPVDTNFNKVAKGGFKVHGIDPSYVAKYAVKKCLKNKLIIIPTFKMKSAIFLSRFIPTKLLLRITYYIEYRKDN